MKRYVAWRLGARGFGMYHVRKGGPRSMLMCCGARVPDGARLDEKDLVHTDQLCSVCRERDEPRLTVVRKDAA